MSDHDEPKVPPAAKPAAIIVLADWKRNTQQRNAASEQEREEAAELARSYTSLALNTLMEIAAKSTVEAETRLEAIKGLESFAANPAAPAEKRHQAFNGLIGLAANTSVDGEMRLLALTSVLRHVPWTIRLSPPDET